MKLEQQVCSLELAKWLKELGMKQESVWYWVDDGNPAVHDWTVVKKDWTHKTQRVSAFTVAELGEMLPIPYVSGRASYKRSWYCDEPGDMVTTACQRAETEADARAEMLIYLLENKLIEL